MAAAKPAMMPLPRAMVNLLAPERFWRVSSDMLRNASSWQNSFTVNCPIAYGICLCGRGRVSGVVCSFRERGNVLAEDGEETGVEPREPFFAREAHEARGEPGGVAALRDEPDARRLERSQQNIREEPAASRTLSTQYGLQKCGTHSATEDAPR